jgi:hypothetical protein
MDDQEYHNIFINAIDQGIRAANDGDRRVMGFINKSGCKVNSLKQALDLLLDFKEIYLREFEQSKE